MDILTQAVADTGALHLKNAKGEYMYDGDKPVRVIVHAPGSKAFGAIEARQTQRAVRRMQDNDGKINLPEPEVRAAEEAEDLAAITVRFENLTLGDKTGDELARAVYSEPKLGFINRQVLKFINDWGNFTGGSATA